MRPIVPTKPLRANVLGAGVHAVNMQSAAEYLEACVASGLKGYVCVTGVHGVTESVRSSRFRAALDNALLVVPDGMPTVWVGRSQRHLSMQRVFGPDLMLELCARSLKNGYTHFFYGGKAGIAEELKRNFETWYPGIRILGALTPPFRSLTHKEEAELSAHVGKLKPDILWVGLSTPKQEMFMVEAIEHLDCKLMIGVGAAFDFHTGRIKDAPTWIKEAGLQWFHRLCQEPRRLWKRYLINNAVFVWHLIFQIAGSKRYSLRSEVNTADSVR